MTLAGVAVYAVQAARIDDRVDRDISQEVQEFARFQRTGVDPATGEAFRDLSRLFEVALQRNVADEHQTILAVVEDRVAYYSETRGSGDLVASRALRRAVLATTASAAPRSTWGRVDTTAGPVRYAVLPVTAGDVTGAWVVTYLTDRESAEFGDVMRTYVVVALAALLVVAAVGWFVAGALLAPVRLVRETAQEIGETDLSRRIDVGTDRDDVSALATTFNAMLDRLERAFTTQRAFLDDAGHELRTPITVLRGNLELLDASDPAEVEEVRAIVLDELDRMSRLVDDLTLLAKSERPDFVRPAPIDLAELTDDLASLLPSLAGPGGRRWSVDARADVVVLGDRQRLTQAALQLAANSVRATGDGDEIAVGTRVDPLRSEVALWVRDTGRGIPQDDQARVMGRFVRGRGSDPAEGSGLGLSIVTAIAEGHGGRVDLVSTVGAGTTLTISFPDVRPAGSSRARNRHLGQAAAGGT